MLFFNPRPTRMRIVSFFAISAPLFFCKFYPLQTQRPRLSPVCHIRALFLNQRIRFYVTGTIAGPMIHCVRWSLCPRRGTEETLR